MLKSLFKKYGVATIGQLHELAKDSGIKLIAYTMMDVMA
jgi:peroxiredoxin family protein